MYRFTSLLSGGLATFALMFSWPAFSADGIPSCYDLVNISGVEAEPINRGLVVVIDNTIELDDNLKAEAYQKIINFIGEGDRVIIVSFSAFVQNQYTKIVTDARIDQMLSNDAAYTIPKPRLKELKLCIAGQKRSTPRVIGEALMSVFEKSSDNFPKTELVSTIANIGREVLPMLGAKETNLLIVSDMLEHSAISSFYKGGKVRSIDPKKELKIIDNTGIHASFPQTNVYILGAGYTKKKNYRSAKVMKSIEDFWRLFFERAGARLKSFGTPSLFGEIGR